MPATKLEQLRAKNALLAGKATALPNPTNRAQRAKAEASWVIGDLCRYEDRIWRVGHVSELRMRLDPVTANQVKIFDNVINSYGGSVNVSPNSALPKVGEEELTNDLRRRVAKLEERPKDVAERVVAMTKPEEGKMAEEQEPTPIVPEVSENRKKNQARLEALKAKKAAEKKPVAAAAAAPGTKTAKVKAEPKPKAVKEKRACRCGCGEQVNGYFAQGHDAKFKGWLLKVERGQMAVKELPVSVQKGFEWKKKGDGMVPTLNYKGEKHTGYDKAGA